MMMAYRVDPVGQRQQDGDGGGRTEARQHADEHADDDADQAVQQVGGHEDDAEAVDDWMQEIHAEDLWIRGKGGARGSPGGGKADSRERTARRTGGESRFPGPG